MTGAPTPHSGPHSGTPSGAPPAWVAVDLRAISNNVRILRQAADTAAVMAVVKADGYGHGLLPAARAALNGGASWLGVALLSEAVLLRRGGIGAPVLAWLFTPGADFDTALRMGIDLGVSASWTLDEIAAAARRTGITARVHLKVDTGLGRNGVYAAGSAWPRMLAAATALNSEGAVSVVGVFSHFAYADAPEHPAVVEQTEAFARAVGDAERAGLPLQVRHLANSAATLTAPSTAFDLVRPGLAVYGLSPIPHLGTPATFGLRPAMTVAARVSLVKDIPAGQGISYGHQYVPDRDTRIALVPLGYADGIPRAATNVGPLRLAGEWRTVAGRVCMDQLVLDMGPESRVRDGDVATVFGPGDDGEPTAEDWAQATGTISYEIVTRISTRLPRVYDEGA